MEPAVADVSRAQAYSDLTMPIRPASSNSVMLLLNRWVFSLT